METKTVILSKCPFKIMVPHHWRADGSCRCDDKLHIVMKEWGYRWNEEKKQWAA